jgi:hypothetical protein
MASPRYVRFRELTQLRPEITAAPARRGKLAPQVSGVQRSGRLEQQNLHLRFGDPVLRGG